MRIMSEAMDKKSHSSRFDIFDYIVIGAGTAGGVVAKKLTDDHKTSVLVLEPGINSTALLSDPDILDAILLGSDNKYAFNLISKIEPSLGRQLVTVNGRVIGGSSEVNDMYAVRGSKELYDEWAALTYERQWKYKKDLSLFIENETYTGLPQSSKKRGSKGPIFVRQQHIPENGQMIAIGVDYVKDDVSHKKFARKGVIVSAGFFSSVILQRSGIGKSEDLIHAGITPLIENPNVGYNLQTQAFAGFGVKVDTSQLTPIFGADGSQPIVLGAFIAEHKESLEGRRLQILGAPAPLFIPSPVVASNGWELDLENKSTNIMSFDLIDLNPRSRGTIMASHSDPEAFPSFTFYPLQPNTNDIDFLVDQYINMYNIIQEAKTNNNSGIGDVVYPPKHIFELSEVDKRRQLGNYVRASYSNFYHYGGQCKMGTSIQNGVVNGELDVFGTQNLKVADLSVAPILPDGNTSIPAQMIGLNAVRFIQKNPSPYVLDDNDFEDSEASESDNE